MKIRRGFVSNSSSSSFTCDVCGETESGYDASLSDFEMSGCENGHIFCNRHQEAMLKEQPELQQQFKAIRDGENEDEEYDYYEGPAKFCPVCTMYRMNTDEVLRYVLLRSGSTYASFVKEIREKFAGDYKSFQAAIKQVRTVE